MKADKNMNNSNIPFLYKRKEECCGCTACYAICHQNAISMVEDEEGFEYPEINSSRCIHCYMCVKVCPTKMKCENVVASLQNDEN